MAIDWLQPNGLLIADGWQPDLATDSALDNPAFYKAAMQVQVQAGARVLRADSKPGVLLCRELEASDVRIWAVLQPASKLLALRETSAEELAAEYEARIQDITASGPDLLWLPAVADLEEALVAVEVARRVSQVPVGVGVALGSGPEGLDTVLGFHCEDAAQRLRDAGVDLVGATCQLPIDEMVLVVRLMRKATDLPIAAFPDAGQRELDGEHIVFRETPADFAAKASSLRDAGASVIGGCCGVTSEHIAALASSLS